MNKTILIYRFFSDNSTASLLTLRKLRQKGDEDDEDDERTLIPVFPYFKRANRIDKTFYKVINSSKLSKSFLRL